MRARLALPLAFLLAGCFGDDRDNAPGTCGDGEIDANEGCDDRNTVSGDGCSERCEVETDSPVCGNGTREVGEECDDRNTNDGDGCSAACQVEIPGAVCGNGDMEAGEECDDKNTVSHDGCSAGCEIEELQTVTLSQTTSNMVLPSGSHGCHHSASPYSMAENHYYRVFRLAEHGIAGSFDLDAVSFGVQEADAGSAGATQGAQIRIYRYSNPTVGVTLVEADMEQIATRDIEIEDATMAMATFPINATLAPGDTFVVELFTPNRTDASGTVFYIGANDAGQDRPSYVKMPTTGCDKDVPTSTDSVGWTEMHVVLNVRGKAYQ